jgi:hypothetical protein
VTAFAAHAFLDVYELTSSNEEFEELARAATTFAAESLAVERGQDCFFAYYAGSDTAIHNANLLMAGIFARCSGLEQSGQELAGRALDFTLERQLSTGAWQYGVDRRLAWVDGYHTAYILVSLHDCLERRFGNVDERSLTSGLAYYMRHLFEASGAPRASPESLYPIDIHAASSAIWALSTLGIRSSEATALARRVLVWTLTHMLRNDGRFAFQLHPRFRNSVPYIRWNDAHMLLALACMAGGGDRAGRSA